MSAGALGVVALTTNVVSATPSSASTTPPWEPDGNSVGGLVFYNAAGSIITGGNVTDSPIAAYVAGTTVIRSGDTKATLYGFLPKNGVAPGAWSGEALSASTTYPNGSAPAAVQALAAGTPVVSGQSGDLTVANLESDYPNTDTTSDGYASVYQLRLRTSTAGKALTPTYDSADILISGSGSSATWSVEYTTGTQVTTTTSLATTPAGSASFGSTVTLSATVSPSSAVGSVNFFDGTVELGSSAVSAGTATLSTNVFPGGVQPLKAVFVPTSVGAFTSSTSSVLNLDITPAPTATQLTLRPAGATHFGSLVTFVATVSPANAAGAIAFYDGSKELTTEVPVSGQAIYSTKSLPGGTQALKAVFTPASAVNYSASTSVTTKYKVEALATKTALKESKKSIVKGAKLILTATVTPSNASGSVWFYNGKKRIGTARVIKGRAVLSTKALTLTKRQLKVVDKLKAVYKPTLPLDFNTSSSSLLKVTVTK
jgi:hypothetical protein